MEAAGALIDPQMGVSALHPCGVPHILAILTPSRSMGATSHLSM
jgi:hypothetical protein